MALVEASDAMLKSANVTLIGWQKIGSGLVTALVLGESEASTFVAPVTATFVKTRAAIPAAVITMS